MEHEGQEHTNSMLSPDHARLLDRLTIGAGPASAGTSSAGLRRARTRGAGLEFHEYRHYQPGDDPRSIDWTVEARLNQLVVRVCQAEGDLRLHVLIDVSASMTIGTPDKLSTAAIVTAALNYVAIERRDAAGVSTFDDTVRTFMPPSRGRGQLFRVLELLQSITASGRSSIDHALLQYGAAVHGPGLVAVVSDFFEPGAGLQGLRYLLHRGLTPAVVQIVAPDELHPALGEDVELVDIEDTTGPSLVVGAGMVDAYRRRLERHTESLRAFCLAQGLVWVRLESGTPFMSMLSAFETAGLFTATV
jgi:uncharacterized protein (DUF58 family)